MLRSCRPPGELRLEEIEPRDRVDPYGHGKEKVVQGPERSVAGFYFFIANPYNNFFIKGKTKKIIPA
jgi:hypothetical protein